MHGSQSVLVEHLSAALLNLGLRVKRFRVAGAYGLGLTVELRAFLTMGPYPDA